ncbi:MAG TPA: fibronectin type III domain-containing protein [Candidatus Acidoferrales bacterium]|nr:fibronectin type III domain-containing protein [Candidatus Acidoferrales bacterium]
MAAEHLAEEGGLRMDEETLRRWMLTQGLWSHTHRRKRAHRRRRPRKEHLGELARYGTDPKNLDLTAKSHIRLNQSHDYTVFRVCMDDLAPETTYYYTVDSADSSGVSDGVKSSTKSFTTQ